MFKKTRKNVSFFFSTLSLLAISCVEVYADQPHQSPKESKISALLNSEISVRLTEDGEKMSSADECVAAVFEVEDQMGVEFSYEFFDALVQICESNL